MVKIKMLKTTKGSQNGIVVETFLENEEYSINETLADIFVRQLHCAEYTSEKKMFSGAPQNKMIQSAKTVVHNFLNKKV